MSKLSAPAFAWQIGRVLVGLSVLAILIYTYVLGGPRDGFNPFDYFGYFTNLTSSLMACMLVVAGILSLASRSAGWVVRVRAVFTTCMVIVGVIYNTLVPGTGTAPAWVSVTLHVVFPVVVFLDWVLGPGRRTLRWAELWIVLPYPLVWLVVVLFRGATDGWVPYGFLLPNRGLGSLVAHVVGLLVALIAAGAFVWWTSRFPVLVRQERAQTAALAR